MFKKILLNLLKPHILIIILLIIISSLLLSYVLYNKIDNGISYISYLLAFYTLVVFIIYIVELIKKIKNMNINIKFLKRYNNDLDYKIKLLLFIQIIFGFVFFSFELILGLYYKSNWFLQLTIYYFLLLILRIYIFIFSLKNKLGNNLKKENKIFHIYGYVLSIMNFISIGIIILVFNNEQIIKYNEILVYALATFSFYSIIMTIIQITKYKKYKSPVILLFKIISFFSSIISMLSLEIVMLYTFGEDDKDILKWRFIAISGLGIVIIFITTSIYMIILSKKNNKKLEEGV